MAFETTQIALVEVVDLSNRTADDGNLEDMTGCFTDGIYGTSCEELTAGSEGLRVQFAIPISAVIALTIRFWDDGAMDAGFMSVIPYSDVNSVDDTNEIEVDLNVGGETDFVLDGDFLGDLGDADGAGNFAIRIVAGVALDPKPKAAEVEYEMTWNTAPYTRVTYDNDGEILGSKIVQAYSVISTNPLVLADAPFDTDTSNAVTGEFTLDLYAADWVLIAFDDASPDKMDISDIITHTV
jgi:hypothetical protein